MPGEDRRAQEQRLAQEQARRIAEQNRQKLVAQKREGKDKKLKKK